MKFSRIFAAVVFIATCAAPALSAPVFRIDAQVGLSSLIALSDGHLSRMAATLQTITDSPAAQTGDWHALKVPLRVAATVNVPALLFFAGTDGIARRLDGSGQTVNVGDRAYFAKVMGGEVSIGELVTSRATDRPVAIVAVPVRDVAGKVSGVLGASVYLDELSAKLKGEMGVADPLIFWAIDGTGKIAIHSDASNIFIEPGKSSGALARVRDAMLSNDTGSITYEYRGASRTVIYAKSSLTGWRYGFGVIKP